MYHNPISSTLNSILPLGAVNRFPRPRHLIRTPTPRISVGPGTDAKHWMTAKNVKAEC